MVRGRRIRMRLPVRLVITALVAGFGIAVFAAVPSLFGAAPVAAAYSRGDGDPDDHRDKDRDRDRHRDERRDRSYEWLKFCETTPVDVVGRVKLADVVQFVGVVESGRVQFGDIEFGDIEFGDVQFGDVQFGDVECVVGRDHDADVRPRR